MNVNSFTGGGFDLAEYYTGLSLSATYSQPVSVLTGSVTGVEVGKRYEITEEIKALY